MYDLSFSLSNVNTNQLLNELRAASIPFSQITSDTNTDSLGVVFDSEPSLEIQDEVAQIVAAHVPSPLNGITSYLRDNVAVFCSQLLLEFAAENMSMGITQAGKTRAVSLYLRDVQYYISTYSLYVAVEEIDGLINEGIPADLAPFVTTARMIEFKNKILAYLGG